MKRFWTFSLVAVLGLSLASCSYDDSGIKSEIESLKTRLTSLENSYKQLANYQTIINNLKSVTDVKDNGDGSFTIQFSDNTSITLKGGKDGTNGTNGTNGKDGVTPQFRIQDGNWQVSYDNGATWTTLGSASSNDLFQNVYMDGEVLVLVLADGTEFRVSNRPGGPDGPGGGQGGGQDGPGGGQGGQGDITVVNMTESWYASLYPYGGVTYIYVTEGTGNYGFYGVRSDAGDFTDETFLKNLILEYGQKLRSYYSTNTFTVLSEYSAEEFPVFNIKANDYAALADYVARRDGGDGKYRFLMIGVDDSGSVTGQYALVDGELAVGDVKFNNPEDAVSYGVVNMTGTDASTWRGLQYSGYVYVYRPINETWVSFYAVPQSYDLTDTSVAEGLLKEYEGLIKAYYAENNLTVNTTYTNAGTFQVYSFTQASYGPSAGIINAKEGASGTLQIMMVALKSDLTVSGRYAIVEGTISR